MGLAYVDRAPVFGWKGNGNYVSTLSSVVGELIEGKMRAPTICEADEHSSCLALVEKWSFFATVCGRNNVG